MKKNIWLAVALFALLPLVACLKPKPEDPTDVDGTVTTLPATPGVTTTTLPVEISKFDNTEWLNVLAVLKECLEAEDTSATPANVLNSGKALLLAAKFITENLAITEYGFSQADVTTYRAYAKIKFETVSKSKKATDAEKAEAETLMKGL